MKIKRIIVAGRRFEPVSDNLGFMITLHLLTPHPSPSRMVDGEFGLYRDSRPQAAQKTGPRTPIRGPALKALALANYGAGSRLIGPGTKLSRVASN